MLKFFFPLPFAMLPSFLQFLHTDTDFIDVASGFIILSLIFKSLAWLGGNILRQDSIFILSQTYSAHPIAFLQQHAGA